jgi:hypothetical protein
VAFPISDPPLFTLKSKRVSQLINGAGRKGKGGGGCALFVRFLELFVFHPFYLFFDSEVASGSD